ncbi:hypothetical protein BVX98_02380 [bacterium F11]|nr:hypothetical protein BVX98_02380 [bacterium F11]
MSQIPVQVLNPPSMSYIVFARKYRPQSFDDLVGQLSVSQTLQNALGSSRIAHAYIFSGPRGVGKTTTARILAKCLNCEKGPTLQPCHKCDSCVSIGQGTSMDDVLEIDGASNRGIEQIRELRENAKYSPSKSRYRIYIIDEAHQITKDAFGALLKTLEEPPSHVIFMMATTEVHKIPAPILSRCQRFSLRPIAPDLVFNHLKTICQKEKVKVEDDAIKNIVRFVEGSLRDALSLLDQALVFSPDGITTKSLRDLLGLLPMEVVTSFASVLVEGQPPRILQSLNESVQNGIDLTQLAKDLQHYYHMLLLVKAEVKDPLLSESQSLRENAQKYNYETLERNIRLLSRALEEMRRSDMPRVVFETYALRIGQKTLDVRNLIERLGKWETQENSFKGAKGFSPPAKSIRPSQAPPASLPKSFPTPPKGMEGTQKGASTFLPQQKSSSEGPSLSSQSTALATPPPSTSKIGKIEPLLKETIQTHWSHFIDDVAKIKQSLASTLEEATLSFSETSLILEFDKTFSEQMVNRSLALLESPFLNRFHVLLSIQTKSIPKAAGAPRSKTPQTLEARPRIVAPPPEPTLLYEDVSPKDVEPDVQRVLKFFPGALKRESPSS